MPFSTNPLIVVAVALVAEDDRVLVQQRPAGKSMAGLWEFPGGKVERGETPISALVREIQEETGLRLAEPDLVPACFASEPVGDRDMILLLYLCKSWEGDPHPHDGQSFRWLSLEDLCNVPMPPADAPLVEMLKKIV